MKLKIFIKIPKNRKYDGTEQKVYLKEGYIYQLFSDFWGTLSYLPSLFYQESSESKLQPVTIEEMRKLIKQHRGKIKLNVLWNKTLRPRYRYKVAILVRINDIPDPAGSKRSQEKALR